VASTMSDEYNTRLFVTLADMGDFCSRDRYTIANKPE
jgi:hypothetical protein